MCCQGSEMKDPAFEADKQISHKADWKQNQTVRRRYLRQEPLRVDSDHIFLEDHERVSYYPVLHFNLIPQVEDGSGWQSSIFYLSVKSHTKTSCNKKYIMKNNSINNSNP